MRAFPKANSGRSIIFARPGMAQQRAMRFARTAALAMLIAGLPACETTPPASMSYEACAAARMCNIHGVISARPSGQALMGQLDLPDGRCIAVSLPGDMLAGLEQNGPAEVTLRGRVYDVPADVESMTVEGRTIGLGLCGRFFLFVYDGSAVIPYTPRSRGAAALRLDPSLEIGPQGS